MASDHAAVIGGKEQRQAGRILRLNALGQGDLLHPRRLGLRRQPQFQLAISDDPAGQYGIHPDAVAAILPGQRLGEAHDAGLGRDIGRHARRAQQRVDRGKIDDGAAACRLQQRDGGLGREEAAIQIDRH